MPSSSACHSRGMIRLPLAVALALAAALPATDTRADRDEDEVVSRSEPEGPAPPPPESDARGSAVVIPAKVSVGAEVDGAALDVLLAAALQDAGFEVLDLESSWLSEERYASRLEEARQAYLEMDLRSALDAARRLREDFLESHGDLLGDPALAEIELFIAQVLLDFGRRDEAVAAAERVLAVFPQRRLDPARHSPAMQALWSSTVERLEGRDPAPPDCEELARLGVSVGADWVAVGVWTISGGGGERLVVHLVPAGEPQHASRHVVEPGARPAWTLAIRGAVMQRFPLPAEPPPAEPPPSGEDGRAGGEEKRAWYRSWWFWTTVGVVVAGGTAGALAGYYANKDPGRPRITMDDGVWGEQ
ncbi:MAG: tetratricopeptide repeat protein [Polyangia bacterium]